MSDYRKRSKNIADQLSLLFADMMNSEGPQDQFIQELENVVYDQEEAVGEFKRQIVIENGDDR